MVARWWIIGLVALGLYSCQYFERKPDTGKGEPLARVENNYLYTKDIEDLGLQNATPEDSTKIITEYIDNWIRRQLLYTYAQRNLPPDKLDVEQLIEDYRQSLIIYTYEREYISQNLDTSVSEPQAREFYQANLANFQLAEDLYRMVFLRVGADAPKQDSIQIWMASEDPFARARLVDYAQTYATDYALNDSTWYTQSRITQRLTELPVSFPVSTPYSVEWEVVPYRYYAWFTARKIKDSPAPFPYVRNDVQQMIVNKRKKQLKKEFNDNIYKDAAKNNTFEIFE